MRGAVGRADLVRLLAALPLAEEACAAALLGFEERAAPREDRAPAGVEAAPAAPVELAPTRFTAAPSHFWRIEEMTFTGEPEPSEEPSGGLTDADLTSPGRSTFATPRAPLLARWSRLWPILRAALQMSVPGRDPDVPALVRAWGRGEVVRRVPRVTRRVWAGRASVWVDRSERLVPFWSDQADVCLRLRRACGYGGVDVRYLDGRTLAVALRGGRRADFRADPEAPVLVLGDLGTYGSDAERAAWLALARRLARGRVRVAALVPSPPARWDPVVARAWAAVAWERGRLGAARAARQADGFWQARAEALLRLASPAALVQPGLLRALRLLLPAAEADAATEADAWVHRDVRGADATGMVLHAEAAERLRAQFAAEVGAGRRDGVRGLLARWHGELPSELLRAETLVWHALVPGADTPGPLDEALGFAGRLAETMRGGEGDPGSTAAVRRYGRTLLGGMPAVAYHRVPSLGVVWAAAFEGMGGVRVPEGVDPRALYARLGRAGAPGFWAVRQVGGKLVLSPSPGGAWPSQEVGSPGSPVAWLLAARPHLFLRRGGDGFETQFVLRGGLSIPLHPGEGLELRTDRCAVSVRPWQREPWAVAAGRDGFGLWADADVKGVAVRFRWIPPGRFLMGSPEDEAGRFKDEGPLHAVTWTTGRWLADTPVTQALWLAVMGTNPSRFVSADRPVEQVSWDDCQEFLRQVNALVPGLDARLPSEAEWEHACRAGTETATWLGDLDIRGENDAPLLDAIAWYGGNAGVDFELEAREDTTSWPKKQYEHTKGGTHPVRGRDPNPLGLYDILGNVYEWCIDMFGSYSEGDVVNPTVSLISEVERAEAFATWLERSTGLTRGEINRELRKVKGNSMAEFRLARKLNTTRAELLGFELRIVRGGSWRGLARCVRAAYRFTAAPDNDDDRLGFRLARGQAPLPGVEPAPAGTQSGRGGPEASS